MHGLFLLLIANLLVRNYSVCAASPVQKCPPSDLTEPCTCDEDIHGLFLDCQGLSSPQQLEEIFQITSTLKLKTLKITNSSMLHIPSSIFKDTRIVGMSIRGSTFASIFDDPLTSDTLGYILVTDSAFLRGFEWQLLSSSKLEILYFKNTRIRNLVDSTRDGIPSTLRMIMLSQTNVTRINHDFLEKSNSLTAAGIYPGMLRSIDELLFPRTIELIDFRNNRIESVPDELFKKFPSLYSVNFKGNLITTIRKEDLEEINSGSLDLRDNPINCNCDVEWIVKMRLNETNIDGTCAEPNNLKGKSIKELTPSDFDFCKR